MPEIFKETKKMDIEKLLQDNKALIKTIVDSFPNLDKTELRKHWVIKY